MLTTGVERVFLERCRRLTAPAQTLMLVAVADDTGQLVTVRRAAAAFGAGADALEEAERSGLLVVSGDSVTVRHPLVRSAVYQAATGVERRDVHRALADVLDGLEDADRATWHRAAAAERARPGDRLPARRGRASVRSDGVPTGPRRTPTNAPPSSPSTRTPEPGVGSRRLATRGRPARPPGHRPSCPRLASRPDDPLLLADVDRLRARIEFNVGSAADAHRILTRAAQRVSAHDPVRALEMAAAAAVARSHGADSGATLPPGTVDVQVSAHDTTRTRCLKLLLASTLHDIAGNRGAAREELSTAMHLAVDGGPDSDGPVTDLDLLGNLGNAALHLGDDDAHRRCYALMLSTARENSDGMAVLYALQRLTFGLYVSGRWAALRSASEEAVALAHGVGQRALTTAPLAWLTLLSALEGRPDFDERLTALDALVAGNPEPGILARPVEDLARWARGTRAALTGDPAGALHQFRQMRLPALALMAAQERIDAAVRADDRDQAVAWVQDLDSFTAGTALPWAQAAADFGRAMTADSGASELFERSLAHHAAADRPYDRARVQLAYGEFLRRAQRRVDARTHLRAALETFEDLHAEPLADRAGRELRASGETARKRDPSTLLHLTPMELKVAELVSQGLSNKDVAAQCWVSPRTVAFHLRNVFTKTGVTSRGELAHLDLG